MAIIANVNRIFLRRSGVLNALRKADSNFILLRAVAAERWRDQAPIGVVKGVLFETVCERTLTGRMSSQVAMWRPPDGAGATMTSFY
jgi:hypothetical protein